MTKLARPLVSIIIPTFNQAAYIRDALDSTLGQNYRPIEVLVLDGGSTDTTVDILAEYAAKWPELRWWSEPDHGVADAVNKGLTKACGTFVGIQSSDDIYLRGAIATAMQVFQDRPDLGLVYGDGCFINEDGSHVTAVTKYEPFSLSALLVGATTILQSSAFFRLDAARTVGGWRTACFVCDTEFWLRMVFTVPTLKIDAVFSAWRRHPDQRNQQTSVIWESYWSMFGESKEIRGSALRIRLAAKAGRRVFTQHYNPTGSNWFLRLQLWRAILTYPPVVRVISNKAILVPGLGRLLDFAARRDAHSQLYQWDPGRGIDLNWWTDSA
jgi:glycosyltransferase involved in cell wall biosynthesis